MKVNDFLKLDKSGCMYRVVVAEGQGWATTKRVEIEADRNIVKRVYGKWELVGFEIATKKALFLFVEKADD